MNTKKIIYAFIVPLLLTSCNSNPNQSEEKRAINSLRNTSHTATYKTEIYYNKTDIDAADGYLRTDATRVYSFADDGTRGLKISSSKTAINLVKGTRQFETDENDNPIETVYKEADRLLFRDEETGVAVQETLLPTNKVYSALLSDVTSDGIYYPIIFDEEFKNPFDYLQERDLTKIENNKFRLTQEKAAFILRCYEVSSALSVTNCVINTTKDLVISSIDFEIAEEGGEGYSFTRQTYFSVAYTNVGKASTLSRLVPYENNNPALKKALIQLVNAQSYKYYKDYMNEDGTIANHEVGYITREAAFYHQHDDPSDTKVYSYGDDYDYIAAKCAANGKYYGFEYEFSDYSGEYEPKLVMVSTSSAYKIDNFIGLGPKIASISEKIFTLKEGTTNVYYIDNQTLMSVMGGYFDFQFLGVRSSILEEKTDHLELTLSEDGSMVIDTGFTYAEYGKQVTQRIVYTLDASTINHTTLPSYVTIPDTTGLEQY